MPFPIQSGRFAAMVRRFFGIQGHIGLQAIDDVFLTLPVAHPQDVSLEALRGVHRISQAHLVNPVVGQASFSELLIPTITGRIWTLEEVTISNLGAAAAVFNAGSRLTSSAAGSVHDTLDFRNTVTLVGQEPVDNAAALAGGATVGLLVLSDLSVSIPPGDSFVWRPGKVFLFPVPNNPAFPAFSFSEVVQCETVNQGLRVTWKYAWRALEEGEATLG